MGEIQYNCPFCDAPFHSRQALYYHKKNVCEQNPENIKARAPAPEPVKETPPPELPDDKDRFEEIRKNREAYEKEMGEEIPDPYNDEDVDVVFVQFKARTL